MLGIVEEEQETLAACRRRKKIVHLTAGLFRHSERACGRRRHDCGIAERRERHPPQPIGKLVRDVGDHLQRESRLPRSAWTGERDQTDISTRHKVDDLLYLGPTAEERRCRNRQVRPVERPERREIARTKLEDTLLRSEIFEAMHPQIDQRAVPSERCGRSGHDRLSAVRGSRDPSRPVQVGSDIAPLCQKRRACVYSNPHADVATVQSLVRVGGGRERVLRRHERHEEGISLSVDLDPAVPRKRIPQPSAMVPERLAVALVTQLMQQPRRAFDVRKQEGDSARRKVSHHSG
jgi:hypothetical protein